MCTLYPFVNTCPTRFFQYQFYDWKQWLTFCITCSTSYICWIIDRILVNNANNRKKLCPCYWYVTLTPPFILIAILIVFREALRMVYNIASKVNKPWVSCTLFYVWLKLDWTVMMIQSSEDIFGEYIHPLNGLPIHVPPEIEPGVEKINKFSKVRTLMP